MEKPISLIVTVTTACAVESFPQGLHSHHKATDAHIRARRRQGQTKFTTKSVGKFSLAIFVTTAL